MKLQDLFDDADHCAHCGKSLPFDNYHGRRKYCGIKCSTASTTKLDSDARREDRAGRQCVLCPGIISADRTAQAIYCERCAVNRSCKHCIQPFRARYVGRVYCSRECKFEAMATAAGTLPRPCEQCGSIYKPGKPSSRFCSNKCVGRWNAAGQSYCGGSHAVRPELGPLGMAKAASTDTKSPSRRAISSSAAGT